MAQSKARTAAKSGHDPAEAGGTTGSAVLPPRASPVAQRHRWKNQRVEQPRRPGPASRPGSPKSCSDDDECLECSTQLWKVEVPHPGSGVENELHALLSEPAHEAGSHEQVVFQLSPARKQEVAFHGDVVSRKDRYGSARHRFHPLTVAHEERHLVGEPASGSWSQRGPYRFPAFVDALQDRRHAVGVRDAVVLGQEHVGCPGLTDSTHPSLVEDLGPGRPNRPLPLGQPRRHLIRVGTQDQDFDPENGRFGPPRPRAPPAPCRSRAFRARSPRSAALEHASRPQEALQGVEKVPQTTIVEAVERLLPGTRRGRCHVHDALENGFVPIVEPAADCQAPRLQPAGEVDDARIPPGLRIGRGEGPSRHASQEVPAGRQLRASRPRFRR